MDSIPDNIKLPEMMDVLCGDAPCKADLNAKPSDKKHKRGEKLSYGTITPNTLHEGVPESEELKPARSAHASTHNAQILHVAATDAWRWAPYQLVGWALLVLTAHVLNALCDMLDAALPPLRRACEYCCGFAARRWTQCGRARWCGAGAGAAGGALWLLYGTLSVARAGAQWAVRPVAPPTSDKD